ncbi:MAG: sporulation protein Cse60 [Longicatena sp.]
MVIKLIQVKAFDEEHEDDLSDSINDFLDDNEDIQVLDIKYAIALSQDEEEENVFCFSALLIYST